VKIITKQEAKSKGLKRFFTGRPCKKGHISERLVSTHDCVECKNFKGREAYATSGGEWHREYYQANRKEKLAKQKVRDSRRVNEIRDYQARWRREKAEHVRAYREANRFLYAAHRAKRRALQLSATPSWSDAEAIRSLYEEATRLSEETGIPHEVDHIVPLQHPLVCGLHVLENLQILLFAENRQKKNTFAI
jgi:hypothetical protein